MRNPYAQTAYKANNVQSLSPAEQVARLLETAAKHIRRAQEYARQDQFEERYNATEDAMKIISGLQGCLDRNAQTDDMCTVLENYYMTLGMLICEINIHNDADKCDEVIASLKDMAETWRQIERKVMEENQTASATATPENFDAAI